MRKKTFLKLQAAVYTALVLFFLSLPLWAEAVDGDGILFLIILVPVIGYMAFRTFKQIAQTGDDEPIIDPTQYALPEDATAEEGAGYYKRLILFLWLALGALTLITVSDLNDLEAGTALSVSVWAPIAFLYSHFGYWVAVLSVPLLGLILSGALFWRWHQHSKLMPKTLYAIGYWHSEREPYFCKPHTLVDPTWNEQEKQAVIAHIRQAEDIAHYRGFSDCRFCNELNGTSDKSDGIFCFPEGFAHYLEAHQVKPPQLFIDFAMGKDIRRSLHRDAKNARASFQKPSSYQKSMEKHYVDFAWWLIINQYQHEV